MQPHPMCGNFGMPSNLQRCLMSGLPKPAVPAGVEAEARVADRARRSSWHGLVVNTFMKHPFNLCLCAFRSQVLMNRERWNLSTNGHCSWSRLQANTMVFRG